MKDYSSHFRELVELQLPDDSRILMPRGGQDMMILATWRLTGDGFRAAGKRSRMIRIVISGEALLDYARGSNGTRLASDARLVAWLRGQLSTFDPNHDSPLGVEPPAVTWPVDTRALNG
ncbi:MAG TPA: hypothetical protein VNZ53_34335 [Steroidobacteraceae bacterium]|jgi:hypothetical protein|nr:hypothetical protein [Steroidobacteraceae bacterium]